METATQSIDPDPALQTYASDGDPLSSSTLRFELRRVVTATCPTRARPLALRFTCDQPAPRRIPSQYDPQRQIGVENDGTPSIRAGKDWKTKAQSDGDEGPEEHYGWEED